MLFRTNFSIHPVGSRRTTEDSGQLQPSHFALGADRRTTETVSETLFFEASPEAVAELRKLQGLFGDATPEYSIGRAIRTMSVLSPYLRGDTLTIVDPDENKPNEPVENRLVRVVFDNA